MATTKLILYNDALRELGSHPLANLTTTNTRLTELDGAFNGAVEYTLAQVDWGFARRRATLTGVSSSAFPPYTYSYAFPTNYLRKCWLKGNAADEYQIDHAEVGGVFYGFVSSALIEYMSNSTTNLDPANWTPQFARCLALYLAFLTAPKLARAGEDVTGAIWGKLQAAITGAADNEALYLINAQIPANRQPVFRRALEFMGSMPGGVAALAGADKLRYQMNRAWDHAVKYCLEQGAWNFASRRVTLSGGEEPIPGDVIDDIIEGYSIPPAEDEEEDESLPDMAGFEYGFILPTDFLHKIWIKPDAGSAFECDHQFLRNAVYTNVEPVVMEYVALDDDSTDPDNWTANFLEVVAAYLASMVFPDMEGNAARAAEMRAEVMKLYNMKMSDAQLRDAIQQQPRPIPPGKFVRARRGASL